ncbi:MAG: glycoside hydrolase family 127 protein [Anaerolineae bacterium]|nr:glycoside hydrolase family 127 protein [Anaerolineae bacterium]MDW8069876.1 glycoside hydrolase family 127 protein [Anaerolineae bacterium]
MPFGSVRITAGFWAVRREVNRKVSLRHGYAMLEKAGNFHNLRLAAGKASGTYRGMHFADENVYKWLEAMAWEMGNAPDDGLCQLADEAIELIVAAQQPDGYLNSYYQVVEPHRRWSDLDFGHELYCAGHLFQAAIAFRRALNDHRLLHVATRLADHIASVFGPGKKEGACGHPEIEMALVELYRTTGNETYLKMAQFFIDQRGKRRMRGLGANGPEYHQDHVPVRAATEVAGHAVRQMYLVAGVTDLYMETGEPALLSAVERLWRDMTTTKMYVTGGIGSRFDGEAFGEAYELPPDQCYCETCAAIGSLMWNWRLLLLSGESRYADLIERTLYNGILSSPSLDGKHYFYVNPLMLRNSRYVRLSSNVSQGESLAGRPEWHSVACCPPNVMRLLSSLEHYFVTTDRNGLQIHLYGAFNITTQLPNEQPVSLAVETDYPWEGHIHIIVRETGSNPWEMRLRLPEWCSSFRLTLNNHYVQHPVLEKGYIKLARIWQAGDVVDLDLAMPPFLLMPNPRVDAIRGCVAIQRGPLVYCLEGCDQELPDSLLDLRIDASRPLVIHRYENLLDGIVTIEADGYLFDPQSWQGTLYRPVEDMPHTNRRALRLKAIPYYAWGNRGIGSMRVWIPTV